MQYIISEVSKMTDIPIDTIRYYEKVGIISPERVGKYRSYSDEDVYLLCEYKKMRSFGMKMDEVKEFFSIANMNDYAGKFMELQTKYRKMVKYYTSLEKSMRQSVTMIAESDELIGTYRITELPAKYYIDFYLNKDESDSLLQVWKSWVHDFYPLVEYITIFSNNELQTEKPFSEDSVWVNAIDQKIVQELNISINEKIPLIPAQKAIYTVIKRADEPIFNQCFIEEIHAYLSEHQLHVSGNIIGKLISRVKDDTRTIQYVGLWIPIQDINSK